MKLSLHWLGEHVDLSGIDPEVIARELTMRTALIEDVERLGAGLEKVRVGHVVHREKHPNADRLSFCRVDTGDAVHEVVCGAPNVAAGQKIAYAPVGSTLPNGLTLEARKIRGIVSNGMICSLQELGLGDDHDGILVLPADAPIGESFARYQGLDDAVLEIDNKSITHRADLWGHHGFARELAAIFGRPLRPLALDSALRPVPASFPIRVDDPAGCPLYLALRVEVETLPATPEWMQRRLRAVGMRPISLLVDLSNYVMLETGQPTHPFDEERLVGGRIVVRRATAGETIRTLDGIERALTPEDLVIADGGRAVAIAGIMGGQDTEVSASTRHVLLESASFEAARVRRTAGRLGLRTEAVARFEKSLDAAVPELALRRYAELLRRLAPTARVRTEFAAAGGAHPRTPTIVLRADRARLKLGYALATEEMAQRLGSIGCESRVEGESLHVLIPSFRARRDLTTEDDLIEEVGRLAGYDRIPAQLPRLSVKPPAADPQRRLERATMLALVHEAGYCEAMNYSFATDRQLERYHAGASSESFVRLANSLTADATRLRRSLVPGLLDFVARNAVDQADVRLVESGREYHAQGGSEGLPLERRMLAGVRFRRGAAADALLLETRGDLEALFARLRVDWTGRAPTTSLPQFAHPGRAIEIVVRGARIGVLAQLHPQIARRFEIEPVAAVFELELGALAELPRPPRKMTPIPAFPPARRDLAVEVPEAVTVAELLRDIRAAAGPQLAEAALFDVYRGPGLGAGHRSLAFRLEFRAPERTLTDAEIDAPFAAIVARLEKRGARLRQ